MDTSKKLVKLLLQMLALVVVLVLISTVNELYRGRNNRNADIAFTETEISFSDPEGKPIVIPYSEVTAIELLASPDYGEAVDGVVKEKTRLGTWKSEELGEYITHSSTSVQSCILIWTDEGSFAVNYENDRTTAQLFEELQKYI